MPIVVVEISGLKTTGYSVAGANIGSGNITGLISIPKYISLKSRLRAGDLQGNMDHVYSRQLIV